ncbi:MAG TPA: alpha/beta hydrolase [Sphingobium sp.]
MRKPLVMELGDRTFSARAALPDGDGALDLPLIVALHGGGYTSGYFDVAGNSLLARCESLGIPIVALDRPSYGDTSWLDDADVTQSSNARLLSAAISDLWKQFGSGKAGIVLLGHSIGGAIALRIAASPLTWPLIGVAISGIGLVHRPEEAKAFGALPPIPKIDLPLATKDELMFGAAGTFSPQAVKASHAANAPLPRQEIIDISSLWPIEAKAVLAAISAPMHYRQAHDDKLWVVEADEADRFAAACSSARSVDARLLRKVGHCIDLHRAGPAFQLEQLAFALRCAFEANVAAS